MLDGWFDLDQFPQLLQCVTVGESAPARETTVQDHQIGGSESAVALLICREVYTRNVCGHVALDIQTLSKIFFLLVFLLILHIFQ